MKVLTLLGLIIASSCHAATVESEIVRVNVLGATSDFISISTHARFSTNSAVMLQGAAALFISASSVSASSFWGDGSHLQNVVALPSDNSFSAAQTFSSAVYVQTEGGAIQISTGPTIANFFISGSGSLSFEPALHTFSSSTIPHTTTTAGSLGTCLSGSTITITTQGGSVLITLSAAMQSLSGKPAVGFLQDGQFIDNLTATAPLYAPANTNSWLLPMSFSYLVDRPPKGSHSYCITIARIGIGSAAILYDDADGVANEFYVTELR